MPARPIPRPLAQWLRSEGTIKELVQGCQRQQELLTLVRSRLPDPLCDHCCAANLQGSQLILAVDSPAWSGRLRLMQGKLRQELAPLGINPGTVKVVVRPCNPARREARHERLEPLSPANARLIAELAQRIANPTLGQALARLASHGNKD